MTLPGKFQVNRGFSWLLGKSLSDVYLNDEIPTPI